MKHLIKAFLLICICATSILAQQVEQPIRKYVEMPREIGLPLIAVQPDCPIKIEEVRLVAGVEGGFGDSYQLRNISTKPIRSITIASSSGASTTYARETGVLVMPGQLVPKVSEKYLKCKECVKDEIVPLTDELREKLKLKGEMKSIVILMVVSVEFTDGTKYNDEKTYEAMQVLMDDLGEAMRQQKQRAVKLP
ncbi:MAG: hypothetical protein M3367_04030 [Acidobacteriota bacterium]|nr:hypothetical protein [Acidobacteriota bacterium]